MKQIVLILILMEHAQRGLDFACMDEYNKGLNPYFNGTCSKSIGASDQTANALSLNPYFNGTCSKSPQAPQQATQQQS